MVLNPAELPSLESDQELMVQFSLIDADVAEGERLIRLIVKGVSGDRERRNEGAGAGGAGADRNGGLRRGAEFLMLNQT